MHPVDEFAALLRNSCGLKGVPSWGLVSKVMYSLEFLKLPFLKR